MRGGRRRTSKGPARHVTAPAQGLYHEMLRAAVHAVALDDRSHLARVSPRLADPSLASRLWDDELYWSHRSPLLIAHAFAEAEAAGALCLPNALSKRLRALAEAGRRRNAQFIAEGVSVISALGPGAIPLKGMWLLEHDVYPRASRLFGDLDFAVETTAKRGDVVAALTDIGYAYREHSTRDHVAFERVAPGLKLYDGLPALREPIPNFGPHYARIQQTFFVEVHYDIDTSRSFRRPFVFSGADRDDGAKHLVLLCHHLCKHEFAHTIGVVDIALMARSPLVDWSHLADLCHELGAEDTCAAAFGIVAHCFGRDILPHGAAPFQRLRAFRGGLSLGLYPVLMPRPTARGRWLSIRVRRSVRAAYRSGMKAMSPHIPRNFPLRRLHRHVAATLARRRSGTP